MAKKNPKPHGGGTIVTWFDPAPGDACDYQAMKKRGRGYCDDTCGDPAKTILVFKRYKATENGGELEASHAVNLCPLHLCKLLNEISSMLQALVK